MDDGWIGALAAVAAGVIGLITFFVTRRFSALQSEREIRRTWMDFDLKLLDDNAILTLVDNKLNRSAVADTIENRRWRWICYAVRNPLENYYMSIKRQQVWLPNRRICRSPKFPALVSILTPLVCDKEFMDIVGDFSADPEFKRLCERVSKHVYCQARRATAKTSCGRSCYANQRSPGKDH